MHINKNTKKCHYYNNAKKCPFEEVGCKFVHEASEKCFFLNTCSNQLCQFQHNLSDIKGDAKASEADDEEISENESVEQNEGMKDVTKTDDHAKLRVANERLKKYSATIRVLLEENQNLKRLK